MEACVENMLPVITKATDCCTCEKCRYDIMAVALNALPPKYIVTSTGQLYTKLSVLQQQFDVDIIAALTQAVNIVSASPRHAE